MKIGYGRVSKHEQNEALQIEALKAAGCEKEVVDFPVLPTANRIP